MIIDQARAVMGLIYCSLESVVKILFDFGLLPKCTKYKVKLYNKNYNIPKLALSKTVLNTFRK